MIPRDEHTFDPVPNFTSANDPEAIEVETEDQIEQKSEFHKAIEENDWAKALMIARAKRRGLE